MNETKPISLWCGKPVIEMTREELIAALEEMGRREQMHFAQAIHERSVMSAARTALAAMVVK